MIKANLLTTRDGLLVGFDIYGHSGFAEQGYEIVCAAVSSAAFLVANTICEIIKISAQTNVDEHGSMCLRVNRNDANSCSEILLGLKLHLLNLEEQYPENITVNYVEV